MNVLRPPLILLHINLRSGQMFINTLFRCVHQLLPRIERLRPDLMLKVKQEQILPNLGFWLIFWQCLVFFYQNVFWILTLSVSFFPKCPLDPVWNSVVFPMSGVISVELNCISLWPALCSLHLELGESPGPAHSVLSSCWWVLGDGCEEQQVWMDLHQAVRRAVSSLWDLSDPPGICAWQVSELVFVPSHLLLLLSLGLLPRSSTI